MVALALFAFGMMAEQVVAQNTGEKAFRIVPRVYINPGHGGEDSNDRPCPFYNYGVGDTVKYFESISNLSKGKSLVDILSAKGYEVEISRVNNTTADDLDLFEIVALAANSGSDMFFSIHSNATGTKNRVNFPLALYRGFTGDPAADGNDRIAELMMKHLGGNQVASWTRTPVSSGDWTFYNWGYKVGLGVLRYNKLPGMLSEGSFHDYVPERCRLLNPDYCYLEAWNQSLAIDDYFNRGLAWDRGTIAGTLRDAVAERPDECIKHGDDKRKPVNHARVKLINDEGKTVATYDTDGLANGVYVFRNVEPGTYTVKVYYQDTESWRKNLANANPAQPRETIWDSAQKQVTVEANESAYCNFDL